MSVQREEDKNTESRKRSQPHASAEVFTCKCVTQTSESVTEKCFRPLVLPALCSVYMSALGHSVLVH